MKKSPISVIVMLLSALLISAGQTQRNHYSARQEKQSYIYVLSDQDLKIYHVLGNGTLKSVPHGWVDVGLLSRCIMAAPSGRTLYISSDVDTFDAHSGRILVYAINKNGRLSSLGSIEAGTMPLVLAMTKSGRFLYCSAEDAATRQGALHQYRIEANGALTSLKPPTISLGKNLFTPPVVSPSDHYLYVPTTGRPRCFRISRSGALVELPAPPTQANVEDLVFSPSGKFVYCLQSGGIISVGTADGRTGNLSQLRPVARVPPASYGLAISPQRHTVQITDTYI
ncbi:MAG: beta-propeller fold lactonase family protein, partial [Janthinobacterium lividum]